MEMAAANPDIGGNRSMAAPARERRRILALDYGRKRIGLALSDELRLTAQPLQTLMRKNRAEDVRRLRDICREQGVARIIVGHPVHMTGEAGPDGRGSGAICGAAREGAGHRGGTIGRAADELGGGADGGRNEIAARAGPSSRSMTWLPQFSCANTSIASRPARGAIAEKV